MNEEEELKKEITALLTNCKNKVILELCYHILIKGSSK